MAVKSQMAIRTAEVEASDELETAVDWAREPSDS